MPLVALLVRYMLDYEIRPSENGKLSSVSMLHAVPEILEKVVCSVCLNYLETNNLFIHN